MIFWHLFLFLIITKQKMKSNYMTNWKNPTKNKDYVVISELPDHLQLSFRKYLKGKTCPVVKKENELSFDCAFLHDYTKFLNSKQGK